MTAAIQTFVLIGWLSTSSAITVKGYGTAAECDKAAALLRSTPPWSAICIPGPTEPAR